MRVKCARSRLCSKASSSAAAWVRMAVLPSMQNRKSRRSAQRSEGRSPLPEALEEDKLHNRRFAETLADEPPSRKRTWR